MLHLYRRLLAARRASPALQLGDFEWVDAPADVVAWRRTYDSDERLLAVNMGSSPALVDLAGTVEAVSDGATEGKPFDGVLAPDTAVLVRP